MKLKLMPDYECAPIWRDGQGSDSVGNVKPEDLGISPALCEDLWSWAAAYDATLVRDDPARSGFANSAEEQAFDAQGVELSHRLQAELGSAAQVRYRRE